MLILSFADGQQVFEGPIPLDGSALVISALWARTMWRDTQTSSTTTSDQHGERYGVMSCASAFTRASVLLLGKWWHVLPCLLL